MSHDDYEHACDGCTLVYEILFCEWDDEREIDYDQAKRNYRRIIHAIHPDRNRNPAASVAAKCVTSAWAIVCNNERYSSYVQYGTNDPYCCLDAAEFRQSIAYIAELLSMRPVGTRSRSVATDVQFAPADDSIVVDDVPPEVVLLRPSTDESGVPAYADSVLEDSPMDSPDHL